MIFVWLYYRFGIGFLFRNKCNPNWYVSAGIGSHHPNSQVLEDIIDSVEGIMWSNQFLSASEKCPLR